MTEPVGHFMPPFGLCKALLAGICKDKYRPNLSEQVLFEVDSTTEAKLTAVDGITLVHIGISGQPIVERPDGQGMTPKDWMIYNQAVGPFDIEPGRYIVRKVDMLRHLAMMKLKLAQPLPVFDEVKGKQFPDYTAVMGLPTGGELGQRVFAMNSKVVRLVSDVDRAFDGHSGGWRWYVGAELEAVHARRDGKNRYVDHPCVESVRCVMMPMRL